MPETALRTRFAPSPTGLLHLGNLRTALFNFCLARGAGGSFVLRIEDTDRARSREAHLADLCEDLEWLGLAWDEGPRRGGDHGPYAQSAREAIYGGRFAALEEAGRAYPCFCSAAELEQARRAQRAAGRPPRYPGTCRDLGGAEVRRRLAAGERPTLRFRVEGDGEVSFEDLVRGLQRFALADIGDFIIRRSDGTPSFFFSNAVDDALMCITDVLRGEDHLANTPRQLLLLEALQLAAPRYGHLSLVLGAGDAPLSKRAGAAGVRELRSEGFLPLALTNHLARLGHRYAGDGFMDMEALTDGFDVARLSRAPAHHDAAQLRHWQREAVARLEGEALWEWMAGGDERVPALVAPARRDAFAALVHPNVEKPADAGHWAAQLCGELQVGEGASAVLGVTERELLRHAIDRLGEHPDDFRAWTRAVGEAAGRRGKALYMPLRAALTGETHGPELHRVYAFLGRERVAARLEAALRRCDDR